MPRSWRRLSIFGRTFLLMIAALLIAEGIGIALIVNRPPIHAAPVSLEEVAARLGHDDIDADMHPPGPPGPFDSHHGAPPDFERGPDRGFTPGPPELVVRSSSTAPEPPSRIDAERSRRLQLRLAALLHVASDSVLVYVVSGADRFDGAMLGEGFVAGHHLPDGTWRIVASAAQGFPTAFQRQAMILFALGLAVLVPLAWLFARALARPIERFSLAAKRVGADPGAPSLPVEGPAEMWMAIESFNAMQERLNSLLQERTQMIAAIAHDLRTPLTRLAFRLDDLPAPLGEKVNADIQEMKSMISAALDFIRDRNLSVRRERLDFRLLVESVVDDQTDLGHDVSLQSGAPITVEGDPLALRRAVVNLVDNAVKYGTRARLRLVVAKERCTLEIDDDGPGIPENLQRRVFEPFFRAESSRNRDTGGVGLGLAVVRAIVMDHGGHVSLGNRAEGGLRVVLWLPLAARHPS